MKAYLDTSALMRLVLAEPTPLEELRRAEQLVSSELLAVESHRDRMSESLIIATHDVELGRAARAFGFDVIGHDPR